MAFPLRAYGRLLQDVRSGGRSICGVAEMLERPGDPGVALVMRHDVDRMPGRAMVMAALEQSWGIRATYYFRADRAGNFPGNAIRAIADMGHEVGYHYETLSRSGGRLEEAVASFHRNLQGFRTIAPCLTICMHGAPFSRHDNMALLDRLNLSALGLLGDAFRDMGRLGPVYLTDTGGRWNGDRAINRRDIVGHGDASVPDPGEAAFVEFLKISSRLVYICAHPERWPASTLGLVQAALTDGAGNLAKRLLRSGLAHG